MRKKDIVSIAILVGVILWGIFSYTVAEAKEDNEPQLVKMRVTCYAPTGNPTASGVMPFEGGCAAKRDWIGGVAVVYDLDMNYIGTFDINDCGGAKRLKNGTSIDIYRESLSRCYEWVRQYGDYLYVQIIPDAKG